MEDYIKFLEALRIGDVLLKKETLAMMAEDRLTEQRSMYTYGTDEIGYGLGMRTPREGGRRTEFGWGGAAGAFASVDLENDLTIYYSQHVLVPPNRPLRSSIYTAVMADLRGEVFRVQLPEGPDDPTITY